MCKKPIVTLRRFKCPECGQEMIAPRLHHGPTHIGHIKTMYCPICREYRDFVQHDTDRTK